MAQTKTEPPATDAATPHVVDVNRLAEKVYRLMVAELRLEQARGAGKDH
jgi:hypothetical protein